MGESARWADAETGELLPRRQRNWPLAVALALLGLALLLGYLPPTRGGVHVFVGDFVVARAALPLLIAFCFGLAAVRRAHVEQASRAQNTLAWSATALAGYFLLVPAFTGRASWESRQRAQCLSNQRALVIAVQQWAQDHHGAYPPVEAIWQQLHLPPAALTCTIPGKPSAGYGYNAQVAGTTPGAPVLLTADGGNARHLITGVADIDTTRHLTGYLATFTDGHAEFRLSEAAVTLQPHTGK